VAHPEATGERHAVHPLDNGPEERGLADAAWAEQGDAVAMLNPGRLHEEEGARAEPRAKVGDHKQRHGTSTPGGRSADGGGC
jgi:hypothetical protein